MAHPLEKLLVETEKALDAKLYYIALVTSLALPDVCGALESPDGQASGSRYRAWYDQWVYRILAPRGGGATITSDDVYRLRCSFVHQGTTQHKKSSFDRIVFSMPGSAVASHSNIIELDNDVRWMNLDVARFCGEIVNGVRLWMVSSANDPCVMENSKKLVAHRPDGMWPLAKDIPAFW